jgi:glycosyltransferase involved in cell wall biosynthesis
MRKAPTIGYVPFSADLQKPGDRRRFAGYARRRNLQFELAIPGRRYDVLVLSESADVSLWTDYRQGKIVYDLIDSYLAIPRTDAKQLLRGAAKYLVGHFQRLRIDYKGAVQEMCSRADAVVCTTEEQRGDIARYCDNVHIALDLHSSVARISKTDYQAHTPIRIVWEGLGVNVPQLFLVRDVLRALASKTDLSLILVTDTEYYRWLNKIGRIQTLSVARRIYQPVSVEPWIEDSCAQVISSCDIGIIPLDMKDPFVAGKPENKLLLLWRIGMPVVCSATSAYRRAMNAAGTPELACTTSDEWFSALQSLINVEETRRISAQSGRNYANLAWNEEAILARWDSVFASVGIEVK